MTGDFDAIVLAGGAGRRMGGLLKPVVPVAGVRMVDRVLAALAGASRIVVVGPAELRVEGAPGGPELVRIQERPAGGGPVAAIGAAFDAAAFDAAGSDAAGSWSVGAGPAGSAPGGPRAGVVAVVAGDLPLLRRSDVESLVAVVERLASGGVAGAYFAGPDDRPQWLCSAWRTQPVRARLADIRAGRGGSFAGAAMRELFGPLEAVRVRVTTAGGVAAGPGAPPPWFDCDTESDLRRAEEWLSDDRTG